MAVIRKKGRREVGSISTASLPDVIFMILFFFMISTTMRRSETLVQITLPQAAGVERLEKKSSVSYIMIGTPALGLQRQFGTAPRIQLNDSFRTVDDIAGFIASEREKLGGAARESMTVNLKADASTRMGLISDVKQELRRADALRINYAAQPKGGR